jgi:hypothetical protein
VAEHFLGKEEVAGSIPFEGSLLLIAASKPYFVVGFIFAGVSLSLFVVQS